VAGCPGVCVFRIYVVLSQRAAAYRGRELDAIYFDCFNAPTVCVGAQTLSGITRAMNHCLTSVTKFTKSLSATHKRHPLGKARRSVSPRMKHIGLAVLKCFLTPTDEKVPKFKKIYSLKTCRKTDGKLPLIPTAYLSARFSRTPVEKQAKANNTTASNNAPQSCVVRSVSPWFVGCALSALPLAPD